MSLLQQSGRLKFHSTRQQRSLDQSIRGYSLRVEQAKSDMRTMKNNLAEQQQRVSDLETVLQNLLLLLLPTG